MMMLNKIQQTHRTRVDIIGHVANQTYHLIKNMLINNIDDKTSSRQYIVFVEWHFVVFIPHVQ